MPHHGDYQNLIYGQGLQGIVPKVPVDSATMDSRGGSEGHAAHLDYVQARG
jgi:lactate 2-monooxygenase